MSNKVFTDGLIVKRRDNAPDFIICNLSVKVEDFVNWLEANKNNGWVNIDVKRSGHSGKLYAELDTWQPSQNQSMPQPSQPSYQQPPEFVNDADAGTIPGLEPNGGDEDIDDIPFG